MLSEVDLKATISNALDTFWPDFDKSISKLSLRLTSSIAFAIPYALFSASPFF